MNYKIINNDCLIALDELEESSIDSIVTDPPYGLTSITKRFGKEDSAPAKYGRDGSFARLSRGFMGKEWDGSGIEYNIEMWQKCLRVLKPGGYLLAFGGSRTFHRIACSIEDAGFEIRDTIMWLYGAGFPKSMNVGKQLEKRLEDEKTKQKTKHDLLSMWERDIQKTKSNEKTSEMVLQSQLQEQSLQGTMYGEKSKESNLWREKSCLEGWNNIQKTERELQRCKVCEMSKRVSINGEERWICNGTQISDGKTLREMFEQNGSCTSYRPQSQQQQDREFNAIQEQCRTQESREVIEYWNKFGTALKPSFEPIIVARKPFKGSLVDNVIENGVGGINIDECRVGTEERTYKGCSKSNVGFIGGSFENGSKEDIEYTATGRFPANTILTYDETDYEEVCDGFPKDNKGQSNSRYFYCAKASKKDRDEGLEEFEIKGAEELLNREENSDGASWNGKYSSGNAFAGAGCPKKNIHPTVKPTELMQYLVRLVTPKGGTILDPFMGSGSTGKAVMFENKERNAEYKFIGIEKEKEYSEIAEARIKFASEYKEEKEDMNQISFIDFIKGE